ncbi:MAG: 4-hydroxythreonine-4-phosphate dehydrogenase PdxA [Bacillota bacterium]
MKKPIIGITMGDPAGIGSEIIVKALSYPSILNQATPIVFGNKEVIKDAIRFVPSNLEINEINSIKDAKNKYGIIDLYNFNNIKINDFKYGEINSKAGKACIEYIFSAIEYAKSGKLDAVVTGPINKESINKAGYKYSGHTEIFAEKTNTNDYSMMLADKDMKVIHVSTHVSLRNACDLVKKDRVLTVIKLAQRALIELGINNPKIAVSGLNPHAGEQGLFGTEEIEEILPAIEEAKNNGLNVEGPISPDTIFSKVIGGQYDIAVVMYHDQGHIPMKVTGFKYDNQTKQWSSMSGVNATIGLPIIRTSVDHGTAYDKAGEGRANEESMIEAIKMAVQFSNNKANNKKEEIKYESSL